MIDSGQLRQLVEIQRNVPTINAIGESVDVWTTVDRQRAKIVNLLGSEAMLGNQVNATAPVVITMRYTPTVIVEARIKYGERLFDINDIDNVEERNRMLIISAKELA